MKDVSNGCMYYELQVVNGSLFLLLYPNAHAVWMDVLNDYSPSPPEQLHKP